MRIRSRDYRALPQKTIKLEDWPTSVPPYFKSKQDYHSILDKHLEELQSLQNLLYAEDRHALLLIFQAMDAAGKDSAIKHVMSGLNPQGTEVTSFKRPSDEE